MLRQLTWGGLAVIFLAGIVTCCGAVDVGTSQSWRRQRFEAWGTSIGWMGNVIGGWSNHELRDTVYDLLFDDVNHLGLNFARYNIGAGQAPGLSIPRPGAEIEGWVPSAPSNINDPGTWQYDWSADQTQRDFLQAGIDRGVTQVEAYANSAPWWMTISGDVTGAPGSGQNNLSMSNHGIFAEYLATVAVHFESNLGTRFSTMAPMNEPGAGWWTSPGNQEGMNVSKGAHQSSVLLATKSALAAKGLNMRLVAPEETASVESLDSYQKLSTAAKQAVDQINTHTYPFLTGTTNSSLESLNAIASSSGKRLYVSEYGVGGGDQLTSALDLASRISTDLKRSGAQGWTYWQAVENNNGSGWGLMTAPFSSAEAFAIRKQYSAMRQFSSYIRPGSHILNVGGDNVLAAYNPDDDATVIVVTNTSSNSISGQYDFIDRPIFETRLIRTSQADEYRSLGPASVSGSRITLSQPGRNVTTAIVHHRPNLLNNPGFALGGTTESNELTGGWRAEGGKFYSFINNGGDSSGAAALWTDSILNSGAIRQEGIEFEVDQAGVAFQLSLDVLFQNSASAGQKYDADTLIGVEFLGADGESLTHATDRAFLTGIEPIYSDSQYRVFRSARFVAPEGTRYVRPVVRYENVRSGSNSWTYIDNVRLEQIPLAHRGRFYIDGSWDAFDSWEWDADVSRDLDFVFSDLAVSGDVAIGGTESVSRLTFDRTSGMTIHGGGTIRLIGRDGQSMIDARRGDSVVNVVVSVESDVVMRVLPGASLRITSRLDANGFRLEKQGAGDLDIEGGLQLNGGTLDVPLTLTPTVHIDGEAQFDGVIEISAGIGTVFTIGDQYEVISYSALSKPAEELRLPELPVIADWKVSYQPSGLVIQIVEAQLSGDYNLDGVVDAADYTVWRNQLGLYGDSISADGNEDGVVDVRDYDVWKAGYGHAALSAAAQAVPEANALVSIMSFLTGCGLMRRR